MKKLFAIVLVVVLVFAMASVAFAAGNPVISPEKPNTSPSVVPDGKTSPQTGESFSVVWVVLAALVLLAVALFCGKLHCIVIERAPEYLRCLRLP